jgi:transcriptional regulator with XRE-family HTH domain
LGLTQPDVAAEVGITFQQLYKYEKAKNRIGAARLYELSKVLGVPVTFFFEAVEGAPSWTSPKRSKESQQR